MIFLLQEEAGKSREASQDPFHVEGTGERLSSLKLFNSGHIPVSRMPMMTSSA